MELTWNPGRTGMCLHIPESFPISISKGPEDDSASLIEPRHITLFRRESVRPILDPLSEAWSSGTIWVPPIPPLRLVTDLCLAERPPHPEKDPPHCTLPRKTWFVSVADQTLWALWLDMFVEQINTAMTDVHPPWPNPEPERFFHVSLFNNRDGDPFRSIGDINLNDVTGEAARAE